MPKRPTPGAKKMRLDALLVERGLCETKSKAKALKPDIRKAEKSVLSGLDDEELKQLRNILQKLCLSLLSDASLLRE